MKTYREQLAEIEAAIAAVLDRGQEYRIKDRWLTRADARWLFEERARLTPLAAREARGGGIRVRRAVPL